MKVVFCGVFYYQGHIRYLFSIFEKYKKIARVFEAAGIECYFFSKQNEILSEEKILTEEQFNEMLPEIDLLIMWNGSLGLEMEIAEKCKQQGTPIYYTELGWLPQLNTFYFDREGVNFASSITNWNPKQLSETEIMNFKSKLAFYHQCVAKYTGITEDDFVFVPLQVESDSQILRYSSRIKKMQELIDYVVKFIPGKIIFKKHPKDDPGALKFPGRCKFYDTGTTHDFLFKCNYVVTVNSTVGVEALTYSKPVIVLGQAFYGGKGLTYSVNNDSDMISAVEWASKGKVAIETIQSFIAYLFERQWHVRDLDNPEKVMTLISGLTE